MAITHNELTKALNETTEHYFCISIKGGEIFHDISVEGFENKIAMIESIEQYLAKLKQS